LEQKLTAIQEEIAKIATIEQSVLRTEQDVKRIDKIEQSVLRTEQDVKRIDKRLGNVSKAVRAADKDIFLLSTRPRSSDRLSSCRNRAVEAYQPHSSVQPPSGSSTPSIQTDDASLAQTSSDPGIVGAQQPAGVSEPQLRCMITNRWYSAKKIKAAHIVQRFWGARFLVCPGIKHCKVNLRLWHVLKRLPLLHDA
jgi:hypothetical protein